MMRTSVWTAVGMVLLSGLAATGQAPQPTGPNGNPGMYNYPAYPNLPRYPAVPLPPGYPYVMPPNVPFAPLPPGMPYGPQPPVAPGVPQWPGAPYGPTMPYATPPMQPFPGAVGPAPGLPSHTGPGPMRDASEPYLVQPDGPRSNSGAPMPPGAGSEPRKKLTEPIQRFVEFVTEPADHEPYALYEGRRYPAEAKNDNTQVWVQAGYIHWWVRRDNTPPLVTTGDTNNSNPGIIGNPDTVVLLGGGAKVAPDEFSGIQGTVGMWLDLERLQSLEITGFWLGRGNRVYQFAGDGNGIPPLGQPFVIDGIERALLFSGPGILAGRLDARASLDFHGLEMNFARNVLRLDGFTFDTLIGGRYLYMNDFLSLNQSFTVLPGAGTVPFAGNLQQPGSVFLINDSFNMTNRFYGGTLGARVNYMHGRFDVTAAAKVSLGATAHVAVIDGTTSVGTNTATGGSLAQPSNIGRFTHTDFSVVPEFAVTLGLQVTPRMRTFIGYTVIDWSRTWRAGSQVDRNLDFLTVPSQVPTSPNFAPGTVGARPIFPATRTDFWAQGISVGIELKY